MTENKTTKTECDTNDEKYSVLIKSNFGRDCLLLQKTDLQLKDNEFTII